MDLNLIISPKKALEFNDLKIHIEGTTPILEAYIEEVRYIPFRNDEERMAAGRTYVKRLIACCVKKVENLKINGKDWDVSFKNSSNEEITDESYNILMRVFDAYVKKDLIGDIIDFYNKNKDQDSSLFEIIDDQKKN